MFFKDWRECDQSIVPMELSTKSIHYIHARAWHIKGYLGGKHSYLTLWSKEHKDYITCEYTDRETLAIQGAKILYAGTNEYQLHAPFISIRKFNARWFGSDPVIYYSASNPGTWHHELGYKDFAIACDEYPLLHEDFDLLKNNCNTFTSYLIHKLKLDMDSPTLAIGARSRQWWGRHGA